ncbi:hypothetical protein EV383_1500 [Pseudonocardia sediminis]|uniref:PD-(D/E)XK nuclease-like domain-containing protein n=1 Tax=Pseudonocardia sediminis TaxID=1397368 RepID=A0A4Q7UX10_PSEST|nr:hypothetical protein [Pseudonocardia sediminis]RZT84649.1 hypothetical protein EV383_1500 [Pseudonocardia sediminis]
MSDAAQSLTIRPRDGRWAHLSLCVLDAVFSMGARYTTTVNTCRRYADSAKMVPLQDSTSPVVIGTDAEQSLRSFVAEMDAVGTDTFAETVLKNRQRTSPRGGIRKAQAALEYAGALVDAGVERYADLPALFADNTRLAALEGRLRDVPGNGSGDVRLGYLWMLLGDDHTIKPDRMVLRWLERVLGRTVGTGEARTLLTDAAVEIGRTPWELDHAVWNAERGHRRRVTSDPVVRRRHRAHQGRWREEILGAPEGPARQEERDGRGAELVDSMLPISHDGVSAVDAGWNLMSAAAVEYTRARVEVVREAKGVVQEDRLWRNLLSSQPLAFSLVGELRERPESTLKVLSTMTGQKIVAFDRINADDAPFELDGLQAEWAPRPATHTGDKSAADIAAAVRTSDGRRLLITVEVKYTDDFSRDRLEKAGRADRYGPLLERLGLADEEVEALHLAGGTQFLRSVLLTESVRANGECDDVLAVVLGRADDDRARNVVHTVDAAVPSVTVGYWSITGLLDVAAKHPDLSDWAESMAGRYVPDPA